MVLMTDVGCVQLMEKHLVQMTEVNSVQVMQQLKGTHLVCLSAGLMVVQMVQMMESGFVKAGLMAAQKDVTMVQKT